MMFIFNMGVIFRDTAVSLKGFEPRVEKSGGFDLLKPGA